MSMLDNVSALKFMTAGKCTCTIESKKTGAKFTYKISRNDKDKDGDDRNKNMFFVSVDKGYLDFIYAGVVFLRKKGNKKVFEFYKGKKGNYTHKSISIKALLYTLNMLLEGKTDIGVNVYHLGNCSKCGRPLTDPDSIKTGLGPTCASRM